MAKASDIRCEVIARADANRIVRAIHYSGKVVNNSQLHIGVFLGDKCGGALQLGPSMDKRKVLPLVRGTGWNEMIELNRMAFADWLPRNSESRALGWTLRFLRRTYPHLKWVLTFADGTQCGDGTIYRAAGFVLTGIGKNKTILKMPDGSVVALLTMTSTKHHVLAAGGSAGRPAGAVLLPGFQLRYVYFLRHEERSNLTVPELPFGEIAARGASMYRGQRPAPVAQEEERPPNQVEDGGSRPTQALQK